MLLAKLKGLESIWLDVVKIVGDAFYVTGDAARTMNGNRPNIQPPTPTNQCRSGTKIVLLFLSISLRTKLRIATSSKQRF